MGTRIVGDASVLGTVVDTVAVVQQPNILPLPSHPVKDQITTEVPNPTTGRKAAIQFVAGAVGGASTTTLLFPLDSVKTKMQMFPGLYTGAGRCICHVVSSQGICSFYKGLSPALMASVLDCSLQFMTFGICEDLVGKYLHKSDRVTSLQQAQAGALTGLVTATMLSPVELVKCRLQVAKEMIGTDCASVAKKFNINTTELSRNPITLVKNLIRTQGIKGLYAGFSCTLLRNIPGNFAFFGTYHYCQSILHFHSSEPQTPLGVVIPLLSGGCAGVMFWTCTYPVDVIKSRVQIMAVNKNHLKPWVLAKDMLKNEGASAMFNGMKLTLMRAFISCGIYFVIYEHCKKFLIVNNVF